VAGRIILQMDKTEFEDKIILGNQQECGIHSNMGGAHSFCFTVDLQNP
jgi:hypothetical protein